MKAAGEPQDRPTQAAREDATEDLLVALVAEALDCSERGDPPDLERICAAHPELQSAVEDALGLSEAVSARPAPPGREPNNLGPADPNLDLPPLSAKNKCHKKSKTRS